MKGHPLSPLSYLRRNAGKTLPLVAVIILAVLLVSAIISIINSIPLSIRTIYQYSNRMLGVGPRGDPTQTPVIAETIRTESPVKLDRLMMCRAAGGQVKSIVGKWPFAVIGLKPTDLDYYLDRMSVTELKGRRPAKAMPEAIVSEPVARNLNLKLGSVLLSPDETETYSPKHVKVVGIADTDQWLMLVDFDYLDKYHFPPVDIVLAFAKTTAEQTKLDHWASEKFKGRRAQVFAYFHVEKSTNEMFVTLYKILNVVIFTLVLVITFMMGMLINIYQSQRLVEFGLLQALGYTKRQLLKRVIAETLAIILIGWTAGVALAYLGLITVKRILMDPSAFALNPLDPRAYLYTLSVPVAILGAALFTVVRRFRTFDPVGVVERRLV